MCDGYTHNIVCVRPETVRDELLRDIQCVLACSRKVSWRRTEKRKSAMNLLMV